MKFSINVGGLEYNIDCLTNEFYNYHAKVFECPYDTNAFNIEVNEDKLKSYKYYDKNMSIYANEVSYILNEIIIHCLDYNRMIIHGAAIGYNDNAYLFVAPSGTGKTTHIKLWQKYLNDKVTIINGDKPMLEFNDEIIVHGTPWNGKEKYGQNISLPLKAIIFLKQSNINSFYKSINNNSITNLLKQSFYSFDKEYGPKVVKYIEKLVNSIPIYQLECDVSREAFNVCYSGLKVNRVGETK